MEFLSRYFTQVRTHLGGLNTSQRIALSLCLVLIALSVVWLGQWSARPQRVPLLSQTLSADDEANIVDRLRAGREDFVVDNGRILVHAPDRARLLAMLQQARVLPADTSLSFKHLMENSSPFLSRDDAHWRKERALEGELARVLSYFDGLSDAKVFIQVPQRRRIGADVGRASASVTVKSRSPDGLNKALVAGIAEFVSGAVEGLRPDAVKIVDAATGRSYRLPGDDSGLPIDVLDMRRRWESHYARQVEEHLGIPGVRVGVFAELNLDRRQIRDRKLGKPQVSEEESSNTSTSRGSAAAGPGVRPNVGRAVTGGASDESSTTETSRVVLEGGRDEKETHVIETPGDIRRLTASINVPRGYFVGIFKQQDAAAAEPKDADLEPIIKTEIARIRAQVKPLIAAADDNQVEVDWYHDAVLASVATQREAAAGAVAAGAPGYVELLREYGPRMGLGLLALISLVAVMRTARRAQASISEVGRAVERARRREQQAEEEVLERLRTEGGVVGEAQTMQPVLEGREVGADELRRQHIIAQISQMVKDDSNTAVSLVEQWVTQQH
ncbi:MAG: hypothetical protein HUU22_02915 [Phycisphaerae bacterium]|nr:hypothetical protein [Phycisphaerae bacterium]NUQ44966.1 hypothetical protein [Phycisphaerae bacterium]